MIFFDFEVFKHDWLVVAVDPTTRKEHVIVNNQTELSDLYKEHIGDVWVGYNCRNYDQYILKAILLGFDPKLVNDWIIVKDRKGWEFSTLFNKIKLNIYDVMPNIPVSLKVLEGFMGNNIHETSVAFDINRKLTPTEIEETIKYCKFDVYNTIEVFMRRINEFNSQRDLVKAFNLRLSDLGKTQAQLAAIILGARRVRLTDDWAIRLPDNLRLGKYQHIGDWFLDSNNHSDKAKLNTRIAGLSHIIAWGGIHGSVTKYSHECHTDEVILDIDVDQLYPTLMIRYGLLSRAVAEPQKFTNILETSLRLKREKKKKEREPYKRICNITYGAMGDKFNPMYDALHRKVVCVYGQVFIIDLLDKIEDMVELIQSNTDGIYIKLNRSDIPELQRRVGEWEARTGLKMSYDEFSKMYVKDVNNYIAVRSDGSFHAKGGYVKDLNDLDYDLPIVNEAIRNYFLYGYSVENTIFGCRELRKFQKIVKLSNKYKWVEHEHGERNIEFSNKAYRVFASLDPLDGRLLKCKTVCVASKGEKVPITERRLNNICGASNGYGWCDHEGCEHHRKRCPYDLDFEKLKLCPHYKEEWYDHFLGYEEAEEPIEKIKRDKFGNTPDRCFICNDDLNGKDIPHKLDYQWYVNLANKRLEDFGVSV